MNIQKLNYLAGRAMGWTLSNGIDMYSDGKWFTGSPDSPHTECQEYEWNPSTCADDALVLLEKKYGAWFLKAWKGGYSCGPLNGEWAVTAVTVPLAMTLCALRAAGIPESEITAAME